MRITYDNKDFNIESGITIKEAFKEQIDNNEIKDIKFTYIKRWRNRIY